MGEFVFFCPLKSLPSLTNSFEKFVFFDHGKKTNFFLTRTIIPQKSQKTNYSFEKTASFEGRGYKNGTTTAYPQFSNGLNHKKMEGTPRGLIKAS